MARYIGFVGGLAMVALAPPAAQAQVATTGRNVTAVTVDAGPNAQFVKQGRDQWAELDARGRTNFRFRERARDDWSVYLVDQSRGVEIQLDLHRRKVTISDRGGPRRDLYDIVRVTHMGSTYPDDRRGWGNERRERDDRPGWDGRSGRGGRDRIEDVEVGPLWNQRDAETKCTARARIMGGEWTGQWRTTVPGRMSVCEIRFDGRDGRNNGRGDGGRDGGWRDRDVTREIEAGPIWSQRDAEMKCRAKAGEMRGEWTGQWRTTIQGRMSVCEIRFR